MQRSGVSLSGHAGPLSERIERYVHVVRAVTALVAGGGPDKVFARLQAQRMLGCFDVDAIEVGIVRLTDLGAVQLRASDEKVNQILRTVEAGESDEVKEGA